VAPDRNRDHGHAVRLQCDVILRCGRIIDSCWSESMRNGGVDGLLARLQHDFQIPHAAVIGYLQNERLGRLRLCMWDVEAVN